MGGINLARWAAGGVVAGIVMTAVVGASAPVTYGRMQGALAAKNLSLPTDPLVFSLLVFALMLVAGLVLVFYYAAATARFGAGPKTAVIMGIAAWVGGPVIMSSVLYAAGLFSWRLTAFGLLVDLVALVLSALAGAAVYREPEAVPKVAAAPA